jgi:hypothetical protein
MAMDLQQPTLRKTVIADDYQNDVFSASALENLPRITATP